MIGLDIQNALLGRKLRGCGEGAPQDLRVCCSLDLIIRFPNSQRHIIYHFFRGLMLATHHYGW